MSTKTKNNLSASLEDYLEAIYNLTVQKEVARSKDIAGALGVAKPSVTVEQVLSISGLPSSKWINRKLETTPVHNRNPVQQRQFVR